MLKRLFSRLGCDLALDLGTASTLISAAGQGLVVDEPSLVAVEQGSRRVLSGGAAVGHLAKQMQGRTGGSIAVVRPLADGVITDFALCEAMLRQFLRKIPRRSWALRPRVLATVPGCITPVEKQALFTSAQRAGTGRVYLISTAKAAALGAGLPIAEPLASMVCDLGGGTTEVAVISLAEVVASSSIRVGGDKFDEAIVSHLRRRYGLKVGLAAAEQLRIDVGSACPLDEELTSEVRGIDVACGLPRRATLTSDEVREALADPLDDIVEAIRAAVDQCSPDLAADLVDHGMALCGGAAQLRGLDRFLSERTGIPARLVDDPLRAVVHGAALCIEQFDEWSGTLESSDDDA